MAQPADRVARQSTSELADFFCPGLVPSERYDLANIARLSLDGEASKITAPPPLLGEHTVDILREIGYPTDDLEATGRAGPGRASITLTR